MASIGSSSALLRLRRVLVAALLGAVVLPLVAAPGVEAAKSKYGVVVVHGDDDISTECVKLTEEKVKALALLNATSFDLYTTADPSFGRALCWIDGEGFPTGSSSCFDPGVGADNWGIWLQKKGQDDPIAPQFGLSSLNVPAGSVLYVQFAPFGGPPDYSQASPPERSLKSICDPEG